MKNLTLRDFVLQGLVAAIYVSISLILAPWTYMNVQFRLAEILMVFVLFNPKFLIGVTLGCFITNFGSELGLIDLFVGTFATFVSGYLMIRTKNVSLSLLWPAIINGLIVGAELTIVFALPFFLTALQVFIGEFVVVCIGGRLLYLVIQKNQGFRELLKN